MSAIFAADDCREAAKSFPGVEHRIELVRTLRGVRYYNDSIASSPTRTVAGLRSFSQDKKRSQKVILIAGGHDKHVSFQPLAEEIINSVKSLWLCGETAEAIRTAVEAEKGFSSENLPITVMDDFRETVEAAARSAHEGDVVLLSPACSSFDKFRNFAARGIFFKKIVSELQ